MGGIMFERGQTIGGRYQIIRYLGAGAMGEVFQTLDKVLNRPMALKVISEELAGDPAHTERMMREAKVMSRMKPSRDRPSMGRVH